MSLSIEMQRTLDNRDPDGRIAHLEAQRDALRQRVKDLEIRLKFHEALKAFRETK